MTFEKETNEMSLRITLGFSTDTFQFMVQVENSRKEKLEVREAEEAGC